MTTGGDLPYDFRVALFARTRRVWVVPVLMAINIVVLGAMTVTGVDPWTPTADDVLRWGADYAPYTLAGQRWRLLTNIFVHAGGLHLALNMLVLLQIGPLIARLLGNRGFLVVYLVSGLCASVASIGWSPYAVSVGASGALFGVFGVLVAYLVRYRGSIPREVLRPLQRTAAVFLALNFVAGLFVRRIDLAAHLAGLVAGFGAGFLVVRPLGTDGFRAPIAREIWVTAGGLVLVAVASALLPRAFDLRREMASIPAQEKEILNRYNAEVLRNNAKEVSNAQLATFIDGQVRPFWQEHETRLVALPRLRGVQKQSVNQMLRYIGVRQQAWSMLAEALRADDRAKAGRSSALQDQADDLAKTAGIEAN